MGNEETYELTSGLLDDYDAEVEDAWFGTHPKFGNGQTAILYWKMKTDDDETPEVEGMFSCGADWESLDGGKTVEHPKGKTKFSNQSAIGTLIARAIELGAGPTLMARGPAQHAEVWVGMRFHMKRETYTYRIQGGEEKTGERLLPEKYLGAEGTDTTASPAEPKTSALEGMDEALVTTLREMKTSTANHSAFVDAAMELTSVTSNPTLVMALAAPDGLYAEL